MKYVEIERGVYKSTDYGAFKFMPQGTNREINKINLNDKKRSISQFGQITPIVINKKNEIVDGQHRFLACKELGIPVVFRFSRNVTTEELSEMNRTTKKWTEKEYVHTKALSGDITFRYVDCLIKEFPEVNMRMVLRSLKKDQSHAFTSPGFVVGREQYENARTILRASTGIYKAIKDGDSVNLKHLEALVTLIASGVIDPGFVEKNLLRNKNYNRLKGFSKMNDIIRDFDEICNFGLKYKRYFYDSYKEAVDIANRRKTK